MSQKSLCECNQGRLPCTRNPQRPAAQLQQDQNATAQRIAVLENAYVRAGEREHALRVELHAAKQKLTELNALGAYGDTLRPFLALMVRELSANSHKGDRGGWLGMTAAMAFNEITYHHDKLGEALSALDYPQISEYAADVANCCMMLLDVMGLLYASAEPINDLCADGAHGFVPFHSTCLKCSEPYSAGPESVERNKQSQGHSSTAEAIKSRDWSGMPIGNKAILTKAIEELEALNQGEPVHMMRSHGSCCWEESSGEGLDIALSMPEEYEVRTLYTRPAEQPAPDTNQWPKLEKPALVGAGRFSAGLSARLVVEAAQRHYEYKTALENETLRIATGENFLALLAAMTKEGQP
ncbi:hypothetical protein ACIPIX_07660 [Pseudomonas protegens]|uniref:hypothetical protein n=1 Tax=Pseudomonas protegens TaxID=380021 RepID=UPI003804EB84